MRRRLLSFVCLNVLVLAGCDTKPPASVPARAPAAPAGGMPGSPAPAMPTTAAGPAAKQVRLSAGTALAQTGPEGEIVGFTADYTVSGQLPPGKLLWVIHRARGENAEVPVELKESGSLPSTILKWRSDEGPFESWIEVVAPEGRQEVSERVLMQ